MDFFKEFELLKLKAPRIGSIRLNPVNSEYTHNTDHCKNCYLIANAVKNEDCMYGRDFYSNQDCVDCDHIADSTLCYECLNCKNCYDSSFLQDCEDCRDCSFGYDLKGCRNCISCVGLRKKEFYIFNEPYSKEKFFTKKKELSTAMVKNEMEKLKKIVPRLAAMQNDTENCVGDYIYHSKNAYSCFDIVECQDIGYLDECKKVKDSWDILTLENAELCYACSSNHILTNCNFCFMCVSSSDLEYCEFVMNSKYCFGCVSLNHKEYHILNRPYPREEYFKKVRKIKEQLKREGTYARTFLTPSYPWEDTVAIWPRM